MDKYFNYQDLKTLIDSERPGLSREFEKYKYAVLRFVDLSKVGRATVPLIALAVYMKLNEIPGWVPLDRDSEYFTPEIAEVNWEALYSALPSNFDPDFELPEFDDSDEDDVDEDDHIPEETPENRRDDKYFEYHAALNLMEQFGLEDSPIIEQFTSLPYATRASFRSSRATRISIMSFVAIQEGFRGPFNGSIAKSLYAKTGRLHNFMNLLGASSAERLAFRVLAGQTELLPNGQIREVLNCDIGRCGRVASELVYCPYCDSAEFICEAHVQKLHTAPLAPDLHFSSTCNHLALDYRDCRFARLADM